MGREREREQRRMNRKYEGIDGEDDRGKKQRDREKRDANISLVERSNSDK